MGLSVSASVAILVVAVVVAVGSVTTAGGNGLERVHEANDAAADRDLDRANSDVSIESATYFDGNETLRVVVTNTGTTTLSVDATDLLADNEFVADRSATVEGDAGTDLWMPGERLQITVDRPNSPDRVKVVAPTGIADRAVV